MTGRSTSRCGLAVVAGMVLLTPAVAGELSYVELAPAASGIVPYQMAPGMGGGLAAADYDDDGDVDIFVPTAEGTPHQLYKNLTVEGGTTLFAEVASEAGLAISSRGRSAVWLDADGDRRLDLVVAGDCFQYAAECDPDESLLRLFRQTETGTFVDVTAEAGLVETRADHPTSQSHRGSITAGDFDNDGDPDLYTTLWLGGTRLFRNDGSGRFEDVSLATGAAGPSAPGVGPWQAVIHDLSGDGLPDIFVAVDFGEDQLLIQQDNGSFLDVAATAGVDRPWNGMGVALGDVDNDLDFDLFVTNITGEFPDGPRDSTFYLNNSMGGAMQFADVGESAGVENVDWGWGVTFLDADNDGMLDIAATNGFGSADYRDDPSRLFINQGQAPVAFSDASAASGFNDTEWGSALASVDLDMDGDLDLLQTCQDGPFRVLINQLSSPDRRYLGIRPRTLGRFSRPLGAEVVIQVGEVSMIRRISAGTSFMTQEPAEAWFGLGAAETVDSVTVKWPGGGQTVLQDVAADQVLTVTDLLFNNAFE